MFEFWHLCWFWVSWMAHIQVPTHWYLWLNVARQPLIPSANWITTSRTTPLLSRVSCTCGAQWSSVGTGVHRWNGELIEEWHWQTSTTTIHQTNQSTRVVTSTLQLRARLNGTRDSVCHTICGGFISWAVDRGMAQGLQQPMLRIIRTSGPHRPSTFLLSFIYNKCVCVHCIVCWAWKVECLGEPDGKYVLDIFQFKCSLDWACFDAQLLS